MGSDGIFYRRNNSPALRSCEKIAAAAIIAALVECVRLFHSPGLNAFRMTTPGALLLGRFFSLWDIAAYWMGIAGSAIADRLAQPEAAATIATRR